MSRIKIIPGELLKNSNLPIGILFFIALIVALITFRNYGITWDEPLFYQYADAVPYAYSIQARLSGNFNIENAYGPSVEDHKMYGPPYILIARPIVIGLSSLLRTNQMETWHLVNFLFFMGGMWFFYLLCKRWLSSRAACIATLFFSTQPILWGHAFINPKDIPFMVLFIMTVYSGFKMVDGLLFNDPENLGGVLRDADRIRIRWPYVKRFWQISGVLSLFITVLLVGFSQNISSIVTTSVEYVYHAKPDSLVEKVFHRIAPNAVDIPVEKYVNKALTLYLRVKSWLLWLSVPITMVSSLVTFFPKLILQTLLWLESSPIGPLPRWIFAWHASLNRRTLGYILMAGITLGSLTSIRIIAPLAGAVILSTYLFRHERRSASGIVLYILVTVISLYAVWPFLWDAPLERFLTAVKYMSNVTNTKPVLFNGHIFMSNALPRYYLPVLLGITLTEPVWILFILGSGLSLRKIWKRQIDWRTFWPMVAWFIIPLGYILIRQPPMYDGFRHFLFILPPVFIVSGVLFQNLEDSIRTQWKRNILVLTCLLPGIVGVIRSHPYQYTYYNTFIGGTAGAFRQYETDYWLTCYKDIMRQIQQNISSETNLYVLRQPAVAKNYASSLQHVFQYEPELDQPTPGSLLLLTTRSNADLGVEMSAPVLTQVEKNGAIFCLVKQIK